MKSAIVRVGLVLALAAVAASARPAVASEGWTEDVDKAMAQAAKEGKDLLMDFTGSDWCGWCIRLDKEVFTKEPFVTEAPKKFVLVKLDFPRRKKLPAKVRERNQQWQTKLGVRGFPTIYVTDAKGRPYAKTGYRRGGPEAYLKHLGELRLVRVKRDKLFADAAKAEGLARAKLLAEAISIVSDQIAVGAYSETVDEIVKLDSENKAGLKAKYSELRVKHAEAQIIATVRQKASAALSGGDKKGAVKVVADAIKQHKAAGTLAQELHFFRSTLLFQNGDKSAAKATLKAAQAAAPDTETAKRINGILERFFKGVS